MTNASNTTFEVISDSAANRPVFNTQEEAIKCAEQMIANGEYVDGIEVYENAEDEAIQVWNSEEEGE